MNEITFPNAASTTAAIIGFNAALATGAAAWPVKEHTYVVNEAVPTISFFESDHLRLSDDGFAHEIASLFDSFSKQQQPLGAEFEAIWDANIDSLYES